MVTVEHPATPSDLCDLIRGAAAAGTAVEIRGGATKALIGTPDRPALQIDMRGFAGIIYYDPAELVLTAGAGTALTDIETALAEREQMLAFEPFDHAIMLGGEAGAATLGGVLAAGISGPRRLSAGSARDHFLGFHAVSGRGEAFVGGAKVVKNVTGYDLPKLMAGSWGQLAALTQVTVKVMPRPAMARTVRLLGLSDEAAHGVMAQILSSPAEVAAAAHLPGGADGHGEAATLFRLEGIAPSIAARIAMIQALVPPGTEMDMVEEGPAAALWHAVTLALPLAGTSSLWRVLVPATLGWRVLDALRDAGAVGLYDWAGGLVWLGLPESADPQAVHDTARHLGGHAMLIRGSAALRQHATVRTPPDLGVAALEARVRAAFDPAMIFDPYRFRARNAD